MSLELVVVCTGNRARSPLAVGILTGLVEGLPVRVSSVGTLRLGALPALPEAVDAAARLGIDLSAHRSRWIGEGPLSDADLVLGFERSHVAAAVVDHGAPQDRTFTLPELVELLRDVDPNPAADPVAHARAAIEAAAGRRRSGRARVPEIADPLGGSPEVFHSTAATVRGLCEELVERLFGRAARRRTAADSLAR